MSIFKGGEVGGEEGGKGGEEGEAGEKGRESTKEVKRERGRKWKKARKTRLWGGGGLGKVKKYIEKWISKILQDYFVTCVIFGKNK